MIYRLLFYLTVYSTAMIKFLISLFKKQSNTLIINHQSFRGWPKSPNIHISSTPINIKVILPNSSEYAEFIYFKSEIVFGIERATYILQDKSYHQDAPAFIWVFINKSK